MWTGFGLCICSFQLFCACLAKHQVCLPFPKPAFDPRWDWVFSPPHFGQTSFGISLGIHLLACFVKRLGIISWGLSKTQKQPEIPFPNFHFLLSPLILLEEAPKLKLVSRGNLIQCSPVHSGEQGKEVLRLSLGILKTPSRISESFEENGFWKTLRSKAFNLWLNPLLLVFIVAVDVHH